MDKSEDQTLRYAKWYMNEALLRAAVDEYGSIEAAALAIGGAHPTTVQKAWRSLGMERRPRGPLPKGTVNKDALARLHAKVFASG